MGKISVLIGSLIMLAAHTITYSNTTISGITFNVQNVTGFFYIWTQLGTTGAGGETITDTFNGTWLEDGELYDNLFGNPIYGIIIMLLILAALALGFIKENNKISGLLLIVAGVLLLVFRYIELNDGDLFFYKSETDFTYLEVPLGSFAGLIFGLLNLRSSS